MKIFKEKQVNPIAGAMLNFDGKPAKILTVSGGRVIVDFNNPLAGKTVVYKINVLRKVEDKDKQINAFNEFLFKKPFKFEIKQEVKPLAGSSASSQPKDKKLIMYVDKQLTKFVEMFKEKYKDVFGLELEVKEVEEKENESKK